MTGGSERTDRVNRGDFWFDFEVLSDGESSRGGSPPPPALDRDATKTIQVAIDDELPWLYSDAGGMPRGRCRGCSRCSAYALSGCEEVAWASPFDEAAKESMRELRVGDKVEVRDRSFVQWIPGTVTALGPVRVRLDGCDGPGHTWEAVRPAAGGGAVGSRAPARDSCERCGCGAARHDCMSDWHGAVVGAMRRFQSTGIGRPCRALPPASRVPPAAVDWEAAEVALFVLTQGLYDPRLHGRGSPPDALDGAGDLVSVITPTSEGRHAFHPLLYESFRTQRYEPKELVVVDTGSRPSQFLQDRAREDERVVYRWWPVDDQRMQDLADIVPVPAAQGEGDGGRLSSGMDRIRSLRRGVGGQQLAHLPARGGPARSSGAGTQALEGDEFLRKKLTGKVRGGVRRKGWTLGMKRNVACHLARGSVVAHFDDDDLYAPGYLEAMRAELHRAACGATAGGATAEGGAARWPPAAVTLKAWHVVDLSDQTFGHFSPLEEPLLHKSQRESFAYGFGFSYVYSRAAWVLSPFADVEWAEDGKFTEALMEKGYAVRLVTPPGGSEAAVAAHSYHRETTSGGEFADMICASADGRREVARSVRMGVPVPAPASLVGLLPVAAEVVAALGLKPWDIHPARYDTAERPVGPEVGLREKEDFLRENPLRGVGR